uniref:Nucleolar and spindle associated protein 1 n=1 Tax=Takifugu rubripes TaxID=31033 RepID=H2U298_TAKRU
MDFDSMKYAELRSLAKELGLKANKKVGTEEAVSAASCGARRGKKRRVSSAKDPETVSTGSHHQPEIGDELAVIADTGQFMAVFPLIGSAKDSKTKPQATRASLISPAPNRRAAEEKRRNTMLSATKAPPKPAGKEDAAFRPSVLSIRRINVRFTEATHDNGSKRSMVKTPARMSSCVASSTPADKGKANSVKTAVLSATKTPGPFVFTGNTSNITTPGAQKPKFDLKASLSRPLTYKPHAGKLKPFGDVKENTTANKSLVSVSSHQKNYKQHQTKTREDRRAKQMQDRKQKKESALGARRGLAMM